MLAIGKKRGPHGAGPLALGLLMIAFAACQYVAGVTNRSANPIPTGCSLSASGFKGPPLQFVDLVPGPATQTVDLCVRSSGGSWGEPMLVTAGTACSSSTYFNTGNAPAGFAYTQVSVAFPAPGNVVDVEVVKAGESCSATPLAQVSGVMLPTSVPSGLTQLPATTLAYIGGNGVAQKLEALEQSDSPNPSNTRVRFMHAMPGAGPLDFGVGVGSVLPTPLAAKAFAMPLSFGQVPTKGEPGQEGPILDNGYDNLASQTYTLVAAPHTSTGTETGVLAQPLTQQSGTTFSLYAIGVAGSTVYPQRGLACVENGSSSETISSTEPTNTSNPMSMVLQTCNLTNLPTLSIDVFSTGLYGPSAPNFAQREAYWENPSNNPYVNGTRTPDLACLIELDYPADATPVLSAAPNGIGATGAGTYPYSYWGQANVTTPPTSPVELGGTASPSMLATPPCAGPTAESTDVTQLVGCFEQYCDTIPNSGSGKARGPASCLTNNCLFPSNGGAGLGTFVSGPVDSSEDYPGCLNCLIDYVQAEIEPFDYAVSTCENSTQPPLSFGGQVPVAILSKYPIVDSDTYILPSTNFRQAVSYVRVQLENSQVDFYCGFFSSTLVAGTLEYPPWGFYGNGGALGDQTSAGAYGQEQLLQAQDLVNWVAKKSGNNPAIIVGDWRSSAGVDSDGGGSGTFPSPQPVDTQTIDWLIQKSGWTQAAASDWTPQCTYCPQSANNLNMGQVNAWFMLQPFLSNWGTPGFAAGATVDESLIFTDNEQSLGTPPSPYFGLNFHVQRIGTP